MSGIILDQERGERGNQGTGRCFQGDSLPCHGSQRNRPLNHATPRHARRDPACADRQSRSQGNPGICAGFILVESMVAVAVIAIALSGLLITQRNGLRLSVHAGSITQQVRGTQDFLEQLQLYRDDLPQPPFSITLRAGTTMGDDAGILLRALQQRLDRMASDAGDVGLSWQCMDRQRPLCTLCLRQQEGLPDRDSAPVCAGPVLL